MSFKLGAMLHLDTWLGATFVKRDPVSLTLELRN